MAAGITITRIIADMQVLVIILMKKKKNGGIFGGCSKDNFLQVNYGSEIKD